MQLFQDIKELLINISFVDLVFFFAILTLMILIVTLIYFIKINDDVLKNEEEKGVTQEMKIVEEITKNLNNDNETINIDFTDYEKDQEDKAIISYDELLKKNTNYEINYENEEYHDDLTVKKFNLDNLLNPSKEHEDRKVDGRVISFAKEEAFLQALKKLQKEIS